MCLYMIAGGFGICYFPRFPFLKLSHFPQFPPSFPPPLTFLLVLSVFWWFYNFPMFCALSYPPFSTFPIFPTPSPLFFFPIFLLDSVCVALFPVFQVVPIFPISQFPDPFTLFCFVFGGYHFPGGGVHSSKH